MKTSTNQSKSPFVKKLMWGILLLGGFMLSSNKGVACTASFTYSAGINGHYSFTSTSVGVGMEHNTVGTPATVAAGIMEAHRLITFILLMAPTMPALLFTTAAGVVLIPRQPR